MDGIVEKWQRALRVAQESNAKGYDFKQTLANVLAGDYDKAAIQAQIDAESPKVTPPQEKREPVANVDV